MPYRTKRTRSRSVRRRRVVRRKVARVKRRMRGRRLRRRAFRIYKNLPLELKRNGSAYNNSSLEIDHSTGNYPSILSLSNISQGDTLNERDGGQIFSRAVRLNLQFINAEYSNPIYVRLLVFRDPCPNATGTITSGANFLYGPITKAEYTLNGSEALGHLWKISGPINPFVSDKVLYDRVIRLNAMSGQEIQSTRFFKTVIRTNKRVTYRETSGNGEQIGRLNFVMWATASDTKVPGAANEVLVSGEVVHYWNDL